MIKRENIYSFFWIAILYTNILPIMLARKTRTKGSRKTILPSAGPGQSPDNPHPIPKSIAPMTSFMSITHVFSQEKFHCVSKYGPVFFLRNNCPTIDTIRAPDTANSNVGSQLPDISKNPMVRLGESISEKARPNQKSIPLTRATREFL
jgi:hypothetical protein